MHEAILSGVRVVQHGGYTLPVEVELQTSQRFLLLKPAQALEVALMLRMAAFDQLRDFDRMRDVLLWVDLDTVGAWPRE